MSTLEARIAEVITTHRAGATNAVQTCCMCDSTWRTHADHDAHAAAPLRQMIRDAKVEALREAVSDFESSIGVGEFAELSKRGPLPWGHIEEAWEHQGPYMDWLRTRADNLEKP